MAEKQEVPLNICHIPKNEFKEGTLFNIPYIQWIDAIISTIIFCYPITQINFVLKVKLIAIGVITATLFFLCLKGYKNRSLSRVIYTTFLHHKSKCILHLRSIKDERSKKYYEKTTEFNSTSKINQRQSYLEKAIEIIREKIQK